MMDEALIDEVAQHGVIYNRQKYYLNGTGSGGGGGGGGSIVPKYETKDEAWQIIAMKMHSDVETCKKRWKYLRERYVSQRKQGDPPVYEHLSRPYLEKMKFLDQHIQPRKSYRNVPNFLTSPHSANNSSGYSEYNMDSKSNGSIKGMNHFVSQHHYHQQSQDQHAMNALSSAAAAASALENVGVSNGHVKLEADQVFRDFAAAVASQQLQQISQSQQLHHHQQQQHHQTAAAAVAAAIVDSSQGYQDNFRDSNSNLAGLTANGCTQPNSNGTALSTAPSPMKSPLSSPLAIATNEHTLQNNTVQNTNSLHNHCPLSNQNYNDANDDLESPATDNFNMKKPRVHLNSHHSDNNAVNNNNNISNNIDSQHNINSSINHASNSHFTDDTDDDSDENSSNMTPAQTMTTNPQENSYNSTTVASTSTAAAAAVAVMQRHSTLSNHHHHHHRHHQQQQPQQQQQQQQQNMFPSNADFLFQLYQQLPHNQAAAAAATQQPHFNKFASQTAVATNSNAEIHQQTTTHRSSEHLLGELVTTELLKMSKERRKIAQKRILEILFFDD